MKWPNASLESLRPLCRTGNHLAPAREVQGLQGLAEAFEISEYVYMYVCVYIYICACGHYVYACMYVYVGTIIRIARSMHIHLSIYLSI